MNRLRLLEIALICVMIAAVGPVRLLVSNNWQAATASAAAAAAAHPHRHNWPYIHATRPRILPILP